MSEKNFEEFGISSLIATQTGINQGKADAIENGAQTPTIKVTKTDDGPVVMDGHSKVYLAHRRGQTTVKAEVVPDNIGLGKAQTMMVQDALKSPTPVKVVDLKPYKNP